MSATLAPIWGELIGQAEAISVLRAAAGANEAIDSQAWLVTGPAGSGRSVAGVLFAAALQCDGAGCGQCPKCQAVILRRDPDVTVVEPTGLSIGVDEVRALAKSAQSAPVQGRWQVFVIEDADRLTESAANALLRAIEEPTARTIWVLCAPSTEDVLITLRSRCRQVGLKTPSAADITELLISRDGVEPAMAAFAARSSLGHVGRARTLARDEQARQRRQEILRLPNSLRDLPSCFEIANSLHQMLISAVEEDLDEQDEVEISKLRSSLGEGQAGITKGRVDRMASKVTKELKTRHKARRSRGNRDVLDLALLELLAYYRDVLMVLVDANVDLIQAELRPAIERSASAATVEATVKRMQSITRARDRLKANADSRLVFEALTVELARAA
jgi:DNA polymerase-3 subunit delta'